MSTNSVTAFNHTIEKSHLWLKELKSIGDFHSIEEAYSILRAVLHTLRDRLVPNEAVHLASQMPMLIRGCYYEGWKIPQTPNKEKTKDEFLDDVAGNLRNAITHVDPEKATRGVFKFLEDKITNGELDDIKAELPKGIRQLWEE